MPSETRTIVFDNADIKDAIAVHHPGAREAGDPDEMGRLSISNESGISIQVLAKDGDGIALSMSEDEVIAALIAHCRAYNIPVPQKAEKSMIIYAGSIGLQLEIP